MKTLVLTTTIEERARASGVSSPPWQRALRGLTAATMISSLFLTTGVLPQPAQAVPRAAPPARIAPAAPAAPAASGTWLQTNWITASASVAVRPSGTGEYVGPVYGICTLASGAACQGGGDSQPGQTLRLRDAGSITATTDLNGDGIPELVTGGDAGGGAKCY